MRSALIEYAGASSAAEAVRNMNKFHFGGPLLEVEQADEHTASTVRTSKTESAEITSSSPSSSSLTSATGTAVAGKQGWNGTGAHVHKSIRDNHCVVILENLVSVAEAADPSLKGEVGEEAERFGPLEDLEIFIDPRKVVVVVLTYTDRGNAQRAYEAFNGRFFGGRQISARIGASSL